MADLPISSLPLASTVSSVDPVAIVVSGITSRATVNTLLTTFSSNTLKSAVELTDELMIYDGTLLKSTVYYILASFINSLVKTTLGTDDQLMIYDSSSLTLLKTTVENILTTFVSSTQKVTPGLSDQAMIYDGDLKYTSVLGILNSFSSSTLDSTPSVDDQIMIYDTSIKRTTINDLITSFNQNSFKSSLSGLEQVMIWDPSTSTLLKTTIDDIVGEIITPINYTYYNIETDTEEGEYRARNLNSTGSFNFTFAFPSNLTSVLNVYLIAAPVSFSGSGNSVTLTSTYGSADTGELTYGIGGSATFDVDFPDSDSFIKIDVTSVFTTSSGASRDAAAGDLAGFTIAHNTISGPVNYYMIELIYEGPGGSGSTVTVVDNLTSTSTTDALSANQGRVLDISKQDISTLQTDIEAISFSSLTVTDDPVSDTDVSNKAYVDSIASTTVIDDLTSTSATDALSANQGRVLNLSKQDISTLEADIVAINFDMLTVVDVPTNDTDVANKLYVDSNASSTVVIDNLTSTSATDALSANQGRVLNITKQDISTLQDDIESITFSILKISDAPVNPTDVANKNYVDTTSGGITVIDNLTSTSTTDALSANQGRVLDISKQDISTLQTDIEAISFSSLTVANMPSNNTDVANKIYVDTQVSNLKSGTVTFDPCQIGSPDPVHITDPISSVYVGFRTNSSTTPIAYTRFWNFMIPEDFVSELILEFCYMPYATDSSVRTMSYSIAANRNSLASSDFTSGSFSWVPGTAGFINVIDVTTHLGPLTLNGGDYIGISLIGTDTDVYWIKGSFYYVAG